MIHVVTIHNQHFYGPQLDDMFRLRHDIFIRRLGWSGLTARNGKETDQFDNESAVYLLNLTPKGLVAAAVRSNPTSEPNLLAEVFSELVDGPLPRSTEILDITRGVVAPGSERWRMANPGPQPVDELNCGILEFALDRGASHITLVVEEKRLERMLETGWAFDRLGQARIYDGSDQPVVAILAHASREALMRARALCNVTGPVLFELSAPDADPAPDREAAYVVEERIAATMDAIGRQRSREIIKEMMEDLMDSMDKDTASAIELIHGFTQTLEHRLRQSDFPTDKKKGRKQAS